MRSVAVVAVLAALAATPALAEGDAAAGEKVFNKCKACHAVGEDAKKKSGPVLNGVIGAEAGSSEDFKYSKGLLAKKEEGLVWDEESLNTFLEKPRDFIPKTKMAFAGLKKEEDRENVIAYLAQFSE